MKIYHNPKCSKSRITLNLIKEQGIEPEIIEYLKSPPSTKELSNIIALLGIKAETLIRKGEAEYKEHFKGKNLSDQEWIEAMISYPKLIERPIVIENGQAIIGRPPEKVLAICQK